MAALGCHLVVSFLYFLIVTIEFLFSMLRVTRARKLPCIKQDHSACQELSAQTDILFVGSRSISRPLELPRSAPYQHKVLLTSFIDTNNVHEFSLIFGLMSITSKVKNKLHQSGVRGLAASALRHAANRFDSCQTKEPNEFLTWISFAVPGCWYRKM